MDDDTIIKARIAARSVHAIAKWQGCSVAEVNRVIDFWADQTITDRIRKHTLTLELARLDELQQVFYERALTGDVASGALVEKLVARRCVMLGLHAPTTAVLRIVEESTPKLTTTDRLERALFALIEDGRDKKDDTAH